VKANAFPTTWCSRPQTSGSVTGLIDLLPTFASVGGVPNPQQYGFEGRDLTPILSDPKASVQDVVYLTYEAYARRCQRSLSLLTRNLSRSCS
jgi:arylsulfatase A-like enzyme